MVKVRGKSRVFLNLKRYSGPETVALIGKGLLKMGGIVENHAKGSIMAGSVSGKGHVPSKPGEPPNNDTRVLHDNIEVVQASPLRVIVSSNAPYAAALEFGTSKMAARPYFRPAMQETEAERTEVLAEVRRRLAQKKASR
jgi:HK97 gp10 family phage protein